MGQATFILSRRQFALAALATACARPGLAAEADATQMMAAAHEATRHAAARFAATLTHQPRPETRLVRSLNGVSRQQAGATARLMRFASPADMRGVATLTIERAGGSDDLWIYLPALHRVRRLVASNRADPWAGSEFALGDIAGHKVADWRHRIVARDAQAGVVQIESLPATPRVASDTGYAKRLTWLREADAATLQSQFFDHAGAALKRLIAAEFQALPGGHLQPLRLTMQSLRGPAVSVLQFSDFRTDVKVPAAEISPEALAT
jgi:uncharacterized protein